MANEVLNNAGSYISTGLNIGSSVIIWVVGILLFIVIVYVIYWILSFKHTVIIKEKVGESFQSNKDKLGYISNKETEEELDNKEINIIPTINSIHKAKIISQKKKQYIQLFAPNKKLQLPKNLYQNLNKKGKKWFELLKVDENLYYPVYISEHSNGEANYKYDKDVVNWVIQDIEQDIVKYKSMSFMDKYGNLIVLGGTLVMVFLILVITYRYSNGIVDKMAPLAKAFSEAAHQLAKAQSTQVLN